MSSKPVRNNKYGTVASEKYLPARKPSGLLHNGKHTRCKQKVNFQEFTQCSAYNPFKITAFNQITQK